MNENKFLYWIMNNQWVPMEQRFSSNSLVNFNTNVDSWLSTSVRIGIISVNRLSVKCRMGSLV